jgi:hypothetical protein
MMREIGGSCGEIKIGARGATLTAVIARLDRAIQYSRDHCAGSRSRGVLDAPVKLGHDTES